MSNFFPSSKRIASASVSAAIFALNLWANPTLAGDPFRTNSPRPIGEKTEAAFNAVFKEGNYKAAENWLQQAETSEANEPLIFALKASLAYTNWDADKKNRDWLDSVQTYTSKTLDIAERLKATDPLRGNLYTAVSHGLEAGTIIAKEGPVKGAPKALGKLQEVYQSLDAAEEIAPQDPELNLLKGWMDLLVAVNLPFSNPNQAIERLEKYNGPARYLADRGIAIAYRDLKQYDKALEYVERSLQQTPNNPELRYLKAQILAKLDKREAAQADFQAALVKPEQLPKGLAAQIFFEQCRNQYHADKNKRAQCDPMRDQIRNAAGTWGPTASALSTLR